MSGAWLIYLCKAWSWCLLPWWAGYPAVELPGSGSVFGFGSAALTVIGNLEGAGIMLKCIMTACPLFLGNLWDMTHRDTDSYMEPLLQSWLGTGPGPPLLYYVSQTSQVPWLKYLIGATPVVYLSLYKHPEAVLSMVENMWQSTSKLSFN